MNGSYRRKTTVIMQTFGTNILVVTVLQHATSWLIIIITTKRLNETSDNATPFSTAKKTNKKFALQITPIIDQHHTSGRRGLCSEIRTVRIPSLGNSHTNSSSNGSETGWKCVDWFHLVRANWPNIVNTIMKTKVLRKFRSFWSS
jgi:hypothetical protein